MWKETQREVLRALQFRPARALPRSFRLGVWIGIIALGVATAGSGSSATPRTLAQWEAAFTSVAADSARTSLFYRFTEAVDTDSLHLTTNGDAAGVARIAAACLAPGRPPVLRMVAARFLARHPHADAADALLAFTRECPSAGCYEAIEALVSLRDSRVIAILKEELREPAALPYQSTIQLLADSGDRRALAVLEAHVVDAIRLNVSEVDLAAARRAIGDLRQCLDAGMYVPFELPGSALDCLRRDGFLITAEAPAGELKNEMYELYTGSYPFVTTDLAFHSFMILARSSLDEMERLVLRPRMSRFCGDLAQAASRRARCWWKGAGKVEARENAAFLGVAAVLLGNRSVRNLELPADWRKRVESELELIRGARGIAPSPILREDEDYAKYRPRGRHSGNREMAGHFQAMIWLGRGTYRLDSDAETRRVLSLLDLLEQHPALRAEWEALDRALGMFFGPRDDLALPDYEAAVRTVFAAAPRGTGGHASDLGVSAPSLSALRAELSHRPAPRINNRGFDTGKDWRARTAGLRIFGQRYTRPAELFQRGLEDGSWPVSCLTIAADLLGSQVAASLLAEDAGVSSQAPARERPAGGAVPVPGSKGLPFEPSLLSQPSLPSPANPYLDLTEGTLHCATALFQVESAAPAFMHRPAWELKSINAALGAWAEVRHATALYNKDANVYLCASPMTNRFHGYVEPVPAFYARLDSLRQRLETGLAECGYFDRLSEERSRLTARRDSVAKTSSRHSRETAAVDELLEMPDRARFAALSVILGRFEALSRAELRGDGQSIADGIFLKGLGGRLKRLAFNTSNSDHARLPMALISDPATEYQSGSCLEVGVGNPATIYVAVPDGDRTFVCRGAVYTFYEFTQPISQRLDDQEWRKLLTGAPESRPTPWITEVMRRRASKP